MPFDTRPGDKPLPITEHTLANCPCGHDDELHESVEASTPDGTTSLVICFECDADDDV